MNAQMPTRANRISSRRRQQRAIDPALIDPELRNRIAAKAAELARQRDGGDSMQNWLDAEAIICANLTHCRIDEGDAKC